MYAHFFNISSRARVSRANTAAFFLALTMAASPAVAFADPATPPLSPLSLERSVAEGMLNNVDLIAAKMGIPSAEADELTAGLRRNPTLQIDTGFQNFGKNWNQTNAGGPKQYDIVLSYPLDLSGKVSAAKRSAHEATAVAVATFQDLVRQKLLQIRLAYFDVLSTQQQLRLAQEKEDDFHRLVQIAEGKIGQKARLPLFQRRAQLARDQASLDRVQKKIALRAASMNLSILLGRSGDLVSINASTMVREFKWQDWPAVEDMIQTALGHRPDLEALRLTQRKSQADKALAKAQVWDDFNIAAGFTTQGPTSANPNDPGSGRLGEAQSWSLALQIPLPTFNRNQGAILKSEVISAQSEHQLRSLELSIRQEVTALNDQLSLNRQLIESYESTQLESARKIHDAQKIQMGSGGSSLLDYLDAMNAYYGTLSSYSDAITEYRRDLARMDAALGDVK